MHRTKKCTVDKCPNFHYGKGYCSKHYIRFKKYGSPHIVKNIRFPGTPEERYHLSYELGEDIQCWDWIRSLTKNGYGIMSIKNRAILAHRFGWITRFGKIPNKKFVCHTCDNRRCQNPKHWFLGSAVDNIMDMVRKGRNKNQYSPK